MHTQQGNWTERKRVLYGFDAVLFCLKTDTSNYDPGIWIENGEATAAEAAGAPAVAIPVTTAAGLPFQPITLVFKDIHYYVPNPAAK